MNKMKFIPLNQIELTNGMLYSAQQTVMEQVIPYQWKVLNDEIPGAEKSHCVENFRIAAGLEKGEFYGQVFQDSDLAKWLEAACYSLVLKKDKKLEEIVEACVSLLEKAQQPDGYLNTYFTVKEPMGRWTNLRDCHELYCAGHLIEAAIAYFWATGSNRMIDLVDRYIDCIAKAIGPEADKKHGYPGHPEIEMALMRLYELTKNIKYEKMASYFIYERGKSPNYFDEELKNRGTDMFPDTTKWGSKYNQSHQPLLEQQEAVGHAVRALYLYSGAADVAAADDDLDLLNTVKRLWENVTDRKMSVTGGVGSTYIGEAFLNDYQLPNDSAYNETCASIALGMFSARMLQIEKDGKYADVLERVIYNGAISGMSMDGKAFFYVNPLEVIPERNRDNPELAHVALSRHQWFACACCPPNVARFYLSLGHLFYGVEENKIYVNLYGGNTARIAFSGGEASLSMETEYPSNGKVNLLVDTKEAYCELLLRIPGWCKDFTISVDGALVHPEVINGYARLKGNFNETRISCDFHMEPVRIWAHPLVRDDAGLVCVQYGPVVYCLEEQDNGTHLYHILLPRKAPLLLNSEDRDWSYGLPYIETWGEKEKEESGSYSLSPPKTEKSFFRFIPYFAWGNRSPGEMLVWLRDKI